MLARGGVGARERLLEVGDIEQEGRGGPPVYHVGVGREEVLDGGERLAQLVEQLAQVIARLGFGGVGPEVEGELLARLGSVPVQEKIGEQGLEARRSEERRVGK